MSIKKEIAYPLAKAIQYYHGGTEFIDTKHIKANARDSNELFNYAMKYPKPASKQDSLRLINNLL